MTKLSTTQQNILELASSREDGKILPFPENTKLNGGAAMKVLKSLEFKGLIEKVDDILVITSMGREAIAIGLFSMGEWPTIIIPTEKPTSAGDSSEESDTKPESMPSNKTGQTPKGKLGAMLALLRREEGATVTDLMEATGWQKHSVRGAMSGQLKTKYAFKIQQIASKGEETVYQIAD